LTDVQPDRDPVAVDAADVARRARTENFPVASVLFPRALRPHLRAVYGFCRLVDILGDEAEGDRLALLDELERELDACYAAPGSGAPAPTWPVMERLAPTIRACRLDREPFRRLIDCNRQDQAVSEYATWADVKQYCTLSADPVGRMVLGVVGLAGEQRLLAASDDVCTGLQLVNFLQDVPRDLELGRIYMPAEDRARFGVTALDRPSPELRELLEFEAARARGLLAGGEVLRREIGGRLGRAIGLFARGGLAALDALDEADWDVYTQRPRPSKARLAKAALKAVLA
jgi:squalene synthase HpnC